MTKPFAIPSGILDKHLGVLGKTGSGKTTVAKGAVETILAGGGRACIVDPTGVWWGLRLGRDGTGRSRFDVVIFGGRHADLPLHAEDGERIARIVGTTSTPAILDTSLLTVGGRTAFFTAFADALVRENRGALHVVVDEAHLFAPQSGVADPRSAAMVHAANNMVSLGRARGLRITLISQRPAKLHKDSLTQVEALIALRLVAPQDRKAVETWIGDQADKATGAKIVSSLPTLETGEGWIWAPGSDLLDRVRFALPDTFDSSRPGAGDDVGELPPIDVAALRDALVAPDDGGAPAAVTSSGSGDRAKRPAGERGPTVRTDADVAAGYRRGVMEGEANAKTGYERGRQVGYQAGLEDAFAKSGAALRALADELVRPGRDLVDRQARPSAKGKSAVDDADRAPVVADAPERSGPTAPQLKVLAALAWWRAMGHEAPTRVQAAVVAGWSPNSSNIRDRLSELNRAGLVRLARGTIGLTEAGAAAAPAPDTSGTLHDRARAILTGPQRAVLDVLLNHRGKPIARDDLARAVGWSPTSSNIRDRLSELARLGLVERPSAKFVQASPWLFQAKRRQS